MKNKLVPFVMLALLACTFLVIPVAAKGPTNSNGGKVINLDPSGPKEWWIIVNKRGWRQWQDSDGDGEVDRFANVLFAEGMNEDAIQDHFDEGWLGPYYMSASDIRYPYVSHGDLNGDGIVTIIWMRHDIPSGE